MSPALATENRNVCSEQHLGILSRNKTVNLKNMDSI